VKAARTKFDRQIGVAVGAGTLALVTSCAFGDRFFNPLVSGGFWIAIALAEDAVRPLPPCRGAHVTGRWLRWAMSLVRRGEGRRDDERRLTIIRHHRVYADHEQPLYRLGVSESVFAAQLEMLVRQDLVPMTVSDGLARLASGQPGHWLALSFDDGYADNVWRALPKLTAAGARATFYLTAGLIEDRRAPWWDELAHALEQTRETRLTTELGGVAIDLPLRHRGEREDALHRLVEMMRVPPAERDHRLAALRMRLGVSRPATSELATWDTTTALVRTGMEIGAHTMTHPHLTTLTPDAQAREIGDSIELIERRLGIRPAGLAYPGGDHDDRTVIVAEACGLAHAVVTKGGVNGPGAPRFELLRRGLSEGACLGPAGRFSRRLAMAELEGAFDRFRAPREAAS
jgi:peptidoglycan/xylan/chitin deacetylase (PgdA/CDA1 family)